MESKVVKKKPEKFDEQFNLIGYRFKKYGFTLIGLLIVGFVVVQVFDIEMWPTHKETVKSIYSRLLILGLLMIAWSREKVEDERIYIQKVKCMAYSFIWIAFMVLIRPLGSIFSKGPATVYTEEALVISMLFFQILIFYFIKYNEKSSEK